MNSLSRFLWFWVWLGLFVYLAFSLWLGFAGLVYPYQLDYGEGIVLWFAQQITRGNPIYKGLSGLPYASSNYPPIALWMAAELMPIFGDGYLAGRLLNFASALVVAALIYRFVFVETQSRSVGALAALFFIGSPYIYNWIPLFRVDMLGLAFTIAGIFLIWQYERYLDRMTGIKLNPGSHGAVDSIYSEAFPFCLLVSAFLLFLLDLFTKHTLFAAPAAACFALFVLNRRLGIAFALALVAVGSSIYLMIDYATGGGFTFGLIFSNATVFLVGQLIELLMNFIIKFPIIIALAVWGWVQRIRARHIGVLEWYAAFSLVALGMAGRVGAWENYFFEAITAACIFAGVSSVNLSSLVTRRTALVLPLILILQIVLIWHDPRIAANLISEGLPANRQLAALLAKTPGTIISEDMGALATSGKQVAYYTFQYSSLARSGQWDQHWELDGLHDGAFLLVILERGTRINVDHYRRFTREFVSALDRYYTLGQTIGMYEIYTPSPLAHLQSADFDDAIALIGWSIQPDSLQSGTLHVTIVWQAKHTMSRRYTAFVHLIEPNGGKVTQDDREPHAGLYPTTNWAVEEMVREIYTLNVPMGLQTGTYSMHIGWYDSETGERLAVPGSVDDSLVLTTFEVR